MKTFLYASFLSPYGDAAAAVTVLLAACASPHTPAPRPAPIALATVPRDSIAHDSIARRLLLDVRQLDPSIVVELRYATRDNFTSAPLAGYEGNRAMLRVEAARAVAEVSRAVADSGWGLKIWDAYRPVRATLGMVDWARRSGRQHLFAQGYISARSRHNLGLAVDLTLIDRASGRELNMGTPYDTFSEAAHTANAGGEAAVNRRRLLRAMSRAGFANYEKEWWHFSFTIPDPVPFDLVIH